MRRRFQLLSLTTLLICTSGMEGRAAETKAKLWVAQVQDSEAMIALSLRAGDKDELNKQSYRLSKLLGSGASEQEGALTSFSDAQRYVCVAAAQSLFNFVLDLDLPPARALKSMKLDAADYRANMSKCEKAGKVPGKRQFPL